MKNYKLAWRNLWRNRRRTMITASSVLFAVFFALIFRSLQLGSYDHMFTNTIQSYSGYLQIQQADWWEDKTVDNSFEFNETLKTRILQDENVVTTIPRFESFALASNGPNTKGVMVMGIDPEKEDLLSGIRDKKVKYRLTPEAVQAVKGDESLPQKTRNLIELFEGTSFTYDGRLLSDLGLHPSKDIGHLPALAEHTAFDNGDIIPGEPGVWLGDNLSAYLDLSIGDTLVLISQGYHGTTAAGMYEIKGIIRQPIPDIDNKIVYLPYDIACQLFNAPERLTSIVLHLQDNSDQAIKETAARLQSLLPENVRTTDWHVMNEVIISQMDADNKSGMIMIGILYLVIAFGVFGTVLMMTAERRREFGMLVAIGMKRAKLASILSYEMFFIGLLGMVLGAITGLVAITYGVYHPLVFRGEMAAMFEDYGMEPIMKFNPADTYFLWQSAIVALMVIIALIYPVIKVANLNVVNALRA